MFFKSKKLVAIDIGTSSIKLAEVEVSKNGCKLLAFGITPTPPNSVAGGDIPSPESAASAIKQVLNETRIKKKNVVTGLSGTSVIVKKITVPKMEKQLIAEQVRWEAEQYIPFDINEISLAHHVLRSSSGGADSMDVLLIAAQNQIVSQYMEAITLAGLQCHVLDVSGFALANCFEMNYGVIPGQCVGLLNIGAGTTNFVVVNGGEVIFTRDIPVGGGTFTTEIQKEMGVTASEAEALKMSAATGREVPAEVHSVISASTESVTEEIRNSFDFFAATSNGLSLGRLFFTGGGSNLPGLIEHIATSAGVSAERMDPFVRVRSQAKNMNQNYMAQVRPLAAVVLGLAMRKMGDS
ncbi:MAG: type IV pilus assembly protein PilM [Pseudobdellovibrionaceae bacterium]